jgi:hypothetical protein
MANAIRGPPFIELNGFRLAISGFSVNFTTGVTVGTLTVSADTAILFPSAVPGGLARLSPFEGVKGIEARLSGGVLQWEAGRIDASVAGLFEMGVLHPRLNISRDAQGPLFGPSDVVATLTGFGAQVTLRDLQIERSGSFSVRAAELSTSGLARALGIANFLPFEIHQVRIDFAENPVTGRSSLDAFELFVSGNFKLSLLSGLPFTPILGIGRNAQNGEFEFSVRVVQGQIQPLNVGPITLGFAGLGIGPAIINQASITLGGYQNGVFTPNFGGNISVTVGSFTGGLVLRDSSRFIAADRLLELSASVTASFNLGPVEVTNAQLDFHMNIQADASFRLAVSNYGLDGGGVERIRVHAGSLVDFTATRTAQQPSAVILNFNARGEEPFATFGSLNAVIAPEANNPDRGMLSGTVSNFALGLNADKSIRFMALAGFRVGVTPPSPSVFGFPDWLPITLTDVSLAFRDIQADPSDVAVTFSASIGGQGGLFGLPVTGTVQGLTIDIALLKAGKFPITNLDSFSIAVDGLQMGGLGITGQFILGLAPLDANGNLLLGADRQNPNLVARRELYGFISGGIALPGGIGVDLKFGFSSAGPLVFYVSADVPILLEPNSGLTLNGLRGGISFGEAFPSVRNASGVPDPTLLRGGAFQPASSLTPDQWRERLEQQVATLSRGGSVGGPGAGFLSQPMMFELGATLSTSYLPVVFFDVDIKISTQGAILMSGSMRLSAPGTSDFIVGDVKFFADLRELKNGNATFLFLADIPKTPQVLTLRGFWSSKRSTRIGMVPLTP